MLKKLTNLFKEKGFLGFLFFAIRIVLHRVFHIRLVGDFAIASVSMDRKVFSNRSLKYSDNGYFFLDPMPSVTELNEYYGSF